MTTLHRVLVFTAFLAIGAAVTTAAAPPPQTAAKPAAKPTDTDLAARISHRLDTSAVVGKYDVKATVSVGAATLTGTVATAAQKAEAARLAHVTGVTRVDNKIAVDPGVDKTLLEKAKSGLSKTGEAITDMWITAKVRYHFLGEDALKDSNINVDTNNHVVTLKGTVKSAAGKARAVLLARQTEGVTKVVDQLTVSAKH